MINKEQLKEILKDLTEVAKGFVSNEEIFRESCAYHRGLMIEKNRAMYNYQNPKISEPRASSNEITPKQKAFLMKIKKYQEGMTKQQAFQVISNLKKKGSEY